jgi:hypothetical protein
VTAPFPSVKVAGDQCDKTVDIDRGHIREHDREADLGKPVGGERAEGRGEEEGDGRDKKPFIV